MDELQHNILHALDKRKKNEPDQTNLNSIWLECGSVSRGEFRHAWRVLEESGFVSGELWGNIEPKRGIGRITAAGEAEIQKSLLDSELLRPTQTAQEVRFCLSDIKDDHVVAEFFGLCQGLMAKGKLDPAEIPFLKKWLEDQQSSRSIRLLLGRP